MDENGSSMSISSFMEMAVATANHTNTTTSSSSAWTFVSPVLPAFYLQLLELSLFATGIFVGGSALKLIKGCSIIGEILFGILLGPNGANLIPYPSAWMLCGKIGTFLGMADAGLDFDLNGLKLVGRRAILVAVVSCILPMVMVALVMYAMGFPFFPDCVAAGVALTPTTVGMASRMLREAGIFKEPTGQLVIASAFVSDFLAFLISSVLKTSVGFNSISIGQTLISAVLYLLIFIFLALKVVPPILKKIVTWLQQREHLAQLRQAEAERHGAPPKPKDIRSTEDDFLLATTIGIVLLFGYAGALFASNLLGAFLAGVAMYGQSKAVTQWKANVSPVQIWFVRVFFAATIGFSIQTSDLFRMETFGAGAAIAATSIIAKGLSGLAAPKKLNRWAVGTGLSGRGEFAYVVANDVVSKLADAQNTNSATSNHLLAVVLWGLLLSSFIAPFVFQFALIMSRVREQTRAQNLADQRNFWKKLFQPKTWVEKDDRTTMFPVSLAELRKQQQQAADEEATSATGTSIVVQVPGGKRRTIITNVARQWTDEEIARLPRQPSINLAGIRARKRPHAAIPSSSQAVAVEHEGKIPVVAVVPTPLEPSEARFTSVFGTRAAAALRDGGSIICLEAIPLLSSTTRFGTVIKQATPLPRAVIRRNVVPASSGSGGPPPPDGSSSSGGGSGSVSSGAAASVVAISNLLSSTPSISTTTTSTTGTVVRDMTPATATITTHHDPVVVSSYASPIVAEPVVVLTPPAAPSLVHTTPLLPLDALSVASTIESASMALPPAAVSSPSPPSSIVDSTPLIEGAAMSPTAANAIAAASPSATSAVAPFSIFGDISFDTPAPATPVTAVAPLPVHVPVPVSVPTTFDDAASATVVTDFPPVASLETVPTATVITPPMSDTQESSEPASVAATATTVPTTMADLDPFAAPPVIVEAVPIVPAATSSSPLSPTAAPAVAVTATTGGVSGDSSITTPYNLDDPFSVFGAPVVSVATPPAPAIASTSLLPVELQTTAAAAPATAASSSTATAASSSSSSAQTSAAAPSVTASSAALQDLDLF